MQIYEVLKRDHDILKNHLEKLLALDEEDDNGREVLVKQVRDILIPHVRAEESVFYNSLRAFDLAKDKAMHSYREHMEAETLLRMLQIRDTFDTEWKEAARKLKSSIESHIAEEETEMFTLARGLFTDQEAEMMAVSFERLKPEIKEEGIIGTTWDMVTNLMPPRFKEKFHEQRH